MNKASQEKGRRRAWMPLLLVLLLIPWLPGLCLVEPGHSPFHASAFSDSVPRLPSGPAGPVAFGAYSTRLSYRPDWDRLWPVSEIADVVVRFGDREPLFVFWRGTSYIPCWATEDGAWFTNEFFERRGGAGSGTTSMVEPMSDKQARYSHVRILENTAARVVIHWRYAPVDLDYTQAYAEGPTGWGDWADEYYVLYPDAVGIREATLRSSALSDWIEYQESIVINQPGTLPEDSLHDSAVTLMNLEGESKTYTWTPEGGPGLKEPPEGACIQIVNLKSAYKPVSIVNPDGASFRSYGGHAPGSHFNFWDHWPVSQARSDTRVARTGERPSHTSLSNIRWKPYEETAGSRTWVMMHGMKAEGDDLVQLARSWIRPAELELQSAGFRNKGYATKERAYILIRETAGGKEPLRMTLEASAGSPLVNPAFVVENWGTAGVDVRVDGRRLEPVHDFRFGQVATLEDAKLVVWLRLRTQKPALIEVLPR